jgi:uncharacterized protein (TIGR03086 family)
MQNPTPCSEWDLRELLNHMVYEVLWVPELLMGKTIAEVGTKHDGDVLHSDPQSAWQHAADAALVAVKRADLDAVVHLSYGDTPARDYIVEIANDVLIHGWDIGRSLHCSVVFDETVAKTLYEVMSPRQAELAATGDFGTRIEVPDDATTQVKLLGLLGRHADIEP